MRRRTYRPTATVVVHAPTAHVVGLEPDELQLLLLSAGIAHTRTGTRWSIAAADVLPIAAALRAAGFAVRLSSSTQPAEENR